jgi:hypothetical protein
VDGGGGGAGVGAAGAGAELAGAVVDFGMFGPLLVELDVPHAVRLMVVASAATDAAAVIFGCFMVISYRACFAVWVGG